jgi:hypothetical protein
MAALSEQSSASLTYVVSGAMVGQLVEQFGGRPAEELVMLAEERGCLPLAAGRARRGDRVRVAVKLTEVAEPLACVCGRQLPARYRIAASSAQR